MKRQLIIEIEIPDGLDSDSTIWQNYHDSVETSYMMGRIERLDMAISSCKDRGMSENEFKTDPLYVYTLEMNAITKSCRLLGEVVNGKIDYFNPENQNLTLVDNSDI